MSDRKLTPLAKKLIAAKHLIENPEHWWDGTPNTDDNENKNCAITAMKWAPATILHQTAHDVFGMNAVAVNDQLGHAAVMKLYDHAIACALSEGK